MKVSQLQGEVGQIGGVARVNDEDLTGTKVHLNDKGHGLVGNEGAVPQGSTQWQQDAELCPEMGPLSYCPALELPPFKVDVIVDPRGRSFGIGEDAIAKHVPYSNVRRVRGERTPPESMLHVVCKTRPVPGEKSLI